MKRGKNTYRNTIGLMLGTSLLFSSCLGAESEMSIDNGNYAAEPCIVLTLDTGMMTRVDKKESLTDPECNLKTVDLFFYKTDATDGDACIVTEHIENTTHGGEHKINISEEIFLDLFDIANTETSGSCRVYAVVNVKDEFFTAAGVTKASASIADLRKIKASTPSFATQFADEGGKKAKEGIIMFTKNTKGDNVNYDSDARKASAKIYVKNLAAKIDLYVNFASAVTGADPTDKENSNPEQKWHVAKSSSVPTSEVHMINGVQSVILDGDFDKTLLEDVDYYSVRFDSNYRRLMKSSGEEGEGKYPWMTSLPYYSYPNSWEISPLEQYRTTLLLKVDWLPEGKTDPSDEDVLTTYYSVPLNLAENKLESNKYYRVKVDIQTLGGLNFGEPLELEGSWEVLDWANVEMEADLRQLRYLAVNQVQLDSDGKQYTAVINGDKGLVTIPFESSHAAEIEWFNVTYTSYLDYTSNNGDEQKEQILDPGQTKKLFDGTPSATQIAAFMKSETDVMDDTKNWHCAYIDNVNHTITIKHNIGETTAYNSPSDPGYYSANTAEKYMYYTYFITIKLKHTDSSQNFDNSTITIVHHPAIYVVGELNDNFNTTWDWTNGWPIKNSVDADPFNDRTSGSNISFNNAPRLYGWVRVNHNNYGSAGYGGLAGIQKNTSLVNRVTTRSSSPVMYVVTATQLDGPKEVGGELIDFHIRDPRVTVQNNLQTSGWTSAPHYVNGEFKVTTNSHSLNDPNTSFYYPTDRSDVPEVANALSPRYRVASSFGNPSSGNISSIGDAEKRCASYQEAGYPAGRWRLPTYGELAFVSYLSKKELIPPVFGGKIGPWEIDAKFWTAQGLYKVDNDGQINEVENSGTTRYVRCVYDDWYWVKKDGTPDKIDNPYNGGQVFVWGDKKKPSPQNQD